MTTGLIPTASSQIKGIGFAGVSQGLTGYPPESQIVWLSASSPYTIEPPAGVAQW